MIRTLIGLLLSSLVVISGLKWDDPRVNIVGSGWDILENEPREAIFVLISQQHADPERPLVTTTLADNVIMVNDPSDEFHLYAEVIDQNVNIKDVRDIQVSGGAKFWIVKGSFSAASKIVKKFISKRNHKITRVSSKVDIDTLELQTTQCNISDGFNMRLQQIRTLLQKNTFMTHGFAMYIVDEIINLYGTHFVKKEDLGGILSKTDAVDISSIQQSVDQTLSASASASFSSFFKVNGEVSIEHEKVQEYKQATTDTYIKTLGGDPWKTASTFTYDTWVDSLKNNPATVGVHLSYILDLIRTQYFPTFSFKELMDIRTLFEQRLNVYLLNNYYKGCDDPTAENYVDYANVFDRDLCNYQHSFNFGGLYTVSNYGAFRTPNIITEGYHCPTNYTAHSLLHTEFQGATHSKRVCHGSLFWKRCHTEYWYDHVTTDTYTCMSANLQDLGMYFGGVYTKTVNNDITQGKTCPQKYIPFPIYHNLGKTDVTYVCMVPSDAGAVVSVPFGGLFSSQVPNYMVGDRSICGGGFERHPVGPKPIAELTYCIGIGSLGGQTKDIIPPGYGSTLNEMIELYPIKRFENGSFVGVQVNPLNEDYYRTQVTNLAIGTIPINETEKIFFKGANTRDVGTKTTTPESCYLKEWMIEQGLYQKLQNQLAYRNNGTIPSINNANSTSSETSDGNGASDDGDSDDDDGDHNTAQIVIMSIFIPFGCCIVCIVIAVIVALVCLKQKKSGYDVI